MNLLLQVLLLSAVFVVAFSRHSDERSKRRRWPETDLNKPRDSDEEHKKTGKCHRCKPLKQSDRYITGSGYTLPKIEYFYDYHKCLRAFISCPFKRDHYVLFTDKGTTTEDAFDALGGRIYVERYVRCNKNGEWEGTTFYQRKVTTFKFVDCFSPLDATNPDAGKNTDKNKNNGTTGIIVQEPTVVFEPQTTTAGNGPVETSSPSAEETTPAAGETTQAAGETTPAFADATNANVTAEAKETTAAAEETTPVAQETTGAAEEITPAAEETTPAAKEATSAGEDTTPAAKETTATAEETTPAAEETTAEVKEGTSAAVETTEAVKETTQAVEETTAEAKEATSAAEETTAAAGNATVADNETTPAVEETTAVNVDKAKREAHLSGSYEYDLSVEDPENSGDEDPESQRRGPL